MTQNSPRLQARKTRSYQDSGRLELIQDSNLSGFELIDTRTYSASIFLSLELVQIRTCRDLNLPRLEYIKIRTYQDLNLQRLELIKIRTY